MRFPPFSFNGGVCRAVVAGASRTHSACFLSEGPESLRCFADNVAKDTTSWVPDGDLLIGYVGPGFDRLGWPWFG